MKILAIETSCDETAISIIEANGGLGAPTFIVLAEVTVTQLDLHKAFGGVVPMLAKREHQKALIPVLLQAISESGVHSEHKQIDIELLKGILTKEPELLESFTHQKNSFPFPEIDAVAFTYGPGLEPALWVGINFAKAIAALWNKPLVPVNHMEGHLFAHLAAGETMQFPALGLLVSGGHTELVLAKNWCEYEILGSTRDDAVGEAFDKVARILGLPYPGGPAISKEAEKWTASEHSALAISLPRPMINSNDLDFSFAGLKTAVLYLVQKLPALTPLHIVAIAKEFQDAAIEVLLSKSRRAIEEYSPKKFIIGGGVSANKLLRSEAAKMITNDFPDTHLAIPTPKLSTDNATMIAVAGYIRHEKFGPTPADQIQATGNLSL